MLLKIFVEIRIRDPDPGSEIRVFRPDPDPDPNLSKYPDPTGSRSDRIQIQIRNTALYTAKICLEVTKIGPTLSLSLPPIPFPPLFPSPFISLSFSLNLFLS